MEHQKQPQGTATGSVSDDEANGSFGVNMVALSDDRAQFRRRLKLFSACVLLIAGLGFILGISLNNGRGSSTSSIDRSTVNSEEQLGAATTDPITTDAPSGANGDTSPVSAPAAQSSPPNDGNDQTEPGRTSSNDGAGGDTELNTQAPAIGAPVESTTQPHTTPSLPSVPESTPQPSQTHSDSPTAQPTTQPSQSPSDYPSESPSSLPSETPSSLPSKAVELLYRPGDLTNFEEGLLLSTGLSARVIAKAGQRVQLRDGTRSRESFHKNPDGAATFPDTRPNNPGGWVYVSNSEVKEPGPGLGGVGAVTFDKDGEPIDYKMILKGTTNNCSGGRTPWNTWVSCEEIDDGKIFQVDPYGVRRSEQMTLGSGGGYWESFAFDIRNPDEPHFFATEDQKKGCLRRFTPDPEHVDWVNDPWQMLHSPGVTKNLMLQPDSTGNSGTYTWTENLQAAEANARAHYPESEGIDVYGNELFFVIKRRKELFVLNLDDGTYWKRSTVSGVFDGMPDQMQRILGNDQDLLYFTEERGQDNGIHARDSSGRFYTIFESPVYSDETTGLAFSPDGKHMYVSYQNRGYMFDIFRQDGLPFHAKKLDVRYHSVIP